MNDQKMDSPKDLKWTVVVLVVKSKMNGQKSNNGRFKRLNADVLKE